MSSVLDAFVKFLADTKDIDKVLNQDIPNRAQASGQKAGGLFSGALNKVTAAGAAGGALFASAIEGATKFEDQLRTIQTVAPDLNLDKVGKDILALSRETGKSTDDLTAGFYDLVSAGVAADDAIGVLRDSAKFATGALGSTAESVDLVTSVLNAYGLEAKESARVTDVFAKAVADGKVTAAELGGSIAQIAPIAAQAGVSIEEISAGFAVMTAKGTPAAEAATQMRAAISALLTPNEQLNKIQKETGINFAELAKERGLAVALDELRKATKGNNDEFARSLGSIQAYQFAIQTTGDQAAMFAEQIVDTANSAGLATDQYNIKAQSATEQGNRFAASIKSWLIEFGGPFVQTLGPALQTLNLLGPAFGRSGIAGKAFGAVLGALTTKAIPGVVGAFKSLLTRIDFSVNDLPLPLLLAFDNLKFKLQNSAKAAGGFLGRIFGKAIGAGTAIAEGVSTGLGAIKNSPIVSRAMDAAGKFAGTKFGKAFGVAAAVAAVAAVVFVAKEVQDAIDKQKADLVEGAREFARTATEEQVAGSLEGLKAEMEQQLKDAAFWNAIPFGLGTAMGRAKLEAADGARQVIDAIESELAHQRTAGAIEGALRSQRGGIEDAAGDVGDAIKDGVGKGASDASKVVAKSAGEILTTIQKLRNDLVAQAAGVASALYDPILAAGQLAETQEELRAVKKKLRDKNITEAERKELERRRQELGKSLIEQTGLILTYGTQAEQISKTKAFLASGFWAEAYEDATPEQRIALDEWRRTLEERLSEMVNTAEEKGGNVRDRYTGEIRDGRDDVNRAADYMTGGADAPMGAAGNDARHYGQNVGQNFADGIESKKHAVEIAASHLAGAVGSYLKVSSPAEKGPMSVGGGPGGWGERIIDLIAAGIRGGIGDLVRASEAASQGIAQGFGAHVAGPVLDPALGTVSGVSSAIGRGPVAERGTVQKVYQTSVKIDGLLKARDPFDVARHLQRAAESGNFDRADLDEEYR